MHAWAAIRAEFGPLMRLALPLVLGELGWMTMGLVDTAMVGRVGKEALGAVSVAGILFYTPAVFGTGMMLGLDALVPIAYGARRLADCHRALMAALWLALAVAPAVMGLQWLAVPMMRAVGVNPAVVAEAVPYSQALVWSTPPLLVYAAFRRYLSGLNQVRPVMFALVSANVVNAAGNWLLIFGNWGFPAMGTEGAAWATVLSRVYMASFLVGYALWHDRRAHLGLREVSLAPDRGRMGELARIGAPVSAQIVLEVGVFALATALIGKLEAVWVAAHQLALNAASYSFMIPMGLGSAAAVRVGNALGRGDPAAARRAGWVAILFGTAAMGLAGAAFLSIPRAIGRILTDERSVIEASVPLFALAAVFQLFDGAQGVATGALRGTGNTRIAALVHFVSYWVVGLPISYWLCFHGGWGAAGVWAGLCVALILIGVALSWAWWRLARANFS